MNKCLEIRTGTPGDRFLRECLQDGKAMGEQLSWLVDEVPGEVTALVSRSSRPSDGVGLTSERSIREGCADSRAKDSLSCLARKARTFLEDPDHVLVIEDAMVRRQAPFLLSIDLPSLYLVDQVYWYLVRDHITDVDKIERTLGVIGDWGTVGVMTSWPTGERASVGQEITLATVNQLVARVRRIIVGAYDGEGYLIWYRGGWEGR